MKNLAAPDFSDYYSVRAHSEACFNKLGHIHAASAGYIGVSTFHAYYVLNLFYLQFCGVFNYDYSFFGRD